MINWYPSRIFPTTINNFSPRLEKVLANPQKWGLDSGNGQYRYYTDRYEINRFDHYTGTPYTQWVDEGQDIRRELIIWDRNQIPAKPVEVSLEWWDFELDPVDDIVSSTLVEWLKELSREDGYELTNISEADLNIVQDNFTEEYSMSGGTGEFQPTGEGEWYGLEWTAKVDFSNWRQVKL